MVVWCFRLQVFDMSFIQRTRFVLVLERVGLSFLTATFLALCLGATNASGQECPPCEEYEDSNVTGAREQLAEAFKLSLEVANCSDSDYREQCRAIETLLEETLETIGAIFDAHIEATAKNCMTCDPRPHLWPIADGVTAVVDMLADRGGEGFTDSGRALYGKLDIWKDHRCPCTDESTVAEKAERPVKRNREAEARREIMSRCSEKFANGRRGLLQVFRVPNDRKGCYQSRACRPATVYKGFETKTGFWTYDGEYWYIWEERRGTGGKWVSCEG